jgi:hypothetical protein
VAAEDLQAQTKVVAELQEVVDQVELLLDFHQQLF